MVVVGLTGSIGMGKSTVAARFRAQGIAVFDADAEVHALYRGKAAPLVEAAFAGTTVCGVVDRARLAAVLGTDKAKFATLEGIVHPLVRAAERDFLQAEAARGADLAVLEIPLLFETGGDALVDAVVVVSAPSAMQRARVLDRPGMTPQRLDALLARQIPDAEKRRRADFVVDTGTTIPETERQIDTIIATLRRRKGTALARYWD